MADNEIFKQVSKQANIVDVVSFCVGANNVIKKGKDYVTICPFHDDHDPSMRIDPVRNSYKCWVCDAGGDSINFVAKYYKISQLEALKKVCEITHIPLPESLSNQTSFVPMVEQKYPQELKTLEDINRFYQLSLTTPEASAAREYLETRGLPSDVISHFGIGYAPMDSTRSIAALRGKNVNYEVSVLERSGILSNATDLQDRYSNRIMFPIQDSFGHVIAFSGRRYQEGQEGGKYINSPETPLFKKSEILYHYAQAREAAKKENCLYVVEGFMDVIALYRAGIENAVALMGTALTSDHIKIFERLGVEIRLCLDGDEAGQAGMERALPMLKASSLSYRVVRKYTNAKDSDELLTKFGKEALQEAVKQMLDPFLFLLARQLNHGNIHRKKLEDTLEVQKFIKASAPYYFALNEVAQGKDLQILASVTGLKEDLLLNILKNQNVIIKEEKKKEEEETPKKTQKRTSDREYIRPKTNPQTNFVKDVVFTDKRQNQIRYILQLNALVCSKLDKDYDPIILENEIGLILVIPFDREAMNLFQNSHVDLMVRPLYFLANMFGECYAMDVTRQKLSPSNLQEIKDALLSKKETPTLPPSQIDDMEIESVAPKSEEEEDDLGDFDFQIDDQEAQPYVSGVELKDSDIDLLIQILDVMMLLPEENIYQKDSFNRYIHAESLLKKKHLYKEQSKAKYGVEDAAEFRAQIRKIDLQLKSFGYYPKK